MYTKVIVFKKQSENIMRHLNSKVFDAHLVNRLKVIEHFLNTNEHLGFLTEKCFCTFVEHCKYAYKLLFGKHLKNTLLYKEKCAANICCTFALGRIVIYDYY